MHISTGFVQATVGKSLEHCERRWTILSRKHVGETHFAFSQSETVWCRAAARRSRGRGITRKIAESTQTCSSYSHSDSEMITAIPRPRDRRATALHSGCSFGTFLFA